MGLTCKKRWDDFPIAHRQPKHKGHCAQIHGHNLSIEVEFSAKFLDACGFVVDFGKLKGVKAMLDFYLDHTLLLAQDDPILGRLNELNIAKIFPIPDVSAEGMCAWLALKVQDHLDKEGESVVSEMGEYCGTVGERISLVSITIWEDSKNSCTLRL